MGPHQSQFNPGFAAFGGGSNASVLHPAVAVALVVLTVLIFSLPRRQVIIPLLLGMLLIPSGQNLFIGGVHLYTYRILILVGLARVLSSKPLSGDFLPGGFSLLDKIFLVWAIYRALSVVLLFAQASAAVNQAAFLLDALGGYFIFRTLVRDSEDVQKVVQVFVVVTIISAVDMLIELKTGRNMLGLLGGIRLISEVREGRIRGQGVFQHPIIAGSFAATSLPLFLWLWKSGKAKFAAMVGVASSLVMIFASASSTPVGALLGGIFAICLWPIRKKMRLVRWGIVAFLVGMWLVMKAPIWYVLAHLDVVGGSSGWERAFLLDTFTQHFRDWWLIGTHDNANWGWDMWDQANQFVSEGETGGLVALSCFITMIVICFKKVGNARRAVAGNYRKEWLCWLVGVAVFAQVLVFTGVDYFDQSIFSWYLLLVIVPVATTIPRASVPKKSNIAARRNPAAPLPLREVEVAETVDFEATTAPSVSRNWFV
ncbi:MAG: hypothetical protein ABI076_06680 [Acidobacteriaceae bacterium]